jgi:hypothetical protein
VIENTLCGDVFGRHGDAYDIGTTVLVDYEVNLVADLGSGDVPCESLFGEVKGLPIDL